MSPARQNITPLRQTDRIDHDLAHLVPRLPLWEIAQDLRIGWFKLKRRKTIPRPKSTSFFRVRPWNFAHVLYDRLRRPDLTFIFLLVCFFVSWNYLGNLDLRRPNIFGEKKREKPRRSGLGVDVQHVCKISGSIAWKRRGHLDLCAENCVVCVIAFNYLVTV